MNWRRGFLLAGIHLAIALPLLSWHAWERPLFEKVSEATSAPRLRTVALQESDGEVTFSFDPCNGGFVDGEVPPNERLVISSNLPASFLAGWDSPCPAQWTLSGILNPGHHYGRGVAVRLIAGFCLLIGVQWTLVGAYPLIRPKRLWWGEPGALITACACLGGIPLLLEVVVGAIRWMAHGPPESTRSSDLLIVISGLFSLVALVAWLFWAVLLIRALILGSWRLARGSRRRAGAPIS